MEEFGAGFGGGVPLDSYEKTSGEEKETNHLRIQTSAKKKSSLCSPMSSMVFLFVRLALECKQNNQKKTSCVEEIPTRYGYKNVFHLEVVPKSSAKDVDQNTAVNVVQKSSPKPANLRV